jgi:lysozyme
MAFVNGIDVSDFQGNDIDWSSVKASGYSFAIAKATQGTGNVQTSFAHNISGIRDAGMIAGAYHFLSWESDPRAQGAHFLSVYTPRKGDIPPALDCEAVPAGMSSGACISQISGFLNAVEPHLGGARMLLYMSFSFPSDNLNGGTDFSGHPVWIAAYNTDPFASNVPPAWVGKTPGMVMWQYSDGSIPAPQPPIAGLGSSIDRDRFNGDIDALKAFTLQNV